MADRGAAAGQPIKTVAVFHLGTVGGPGRSLHPALTWLAQRGEVEVIVPEWGWVAELYSPLAHVDVRRYGALTYPRGPIEGAGAARRLARDVRGFRAEFRRRRPDLVLVVTTVLPAVLLAARLERTPVVVYAAEVYSQEWKRAAWLPAWGSLLAHSTSRLAGGLVCCSNRVARQFPAVTGKPMAVAYPPIDPGCERGDRRRGRERYGLDGAAPCLAVVGSISRGRGQDVALRALRLVRDRFPRARLLVVGEPHARSVDLAFADDLRSLCVRLGVTESVVFAGATDEVADVYAAADVVLNPARFEEPFGRVVPEALMAGKPVVAARVGALEEVVRDGVDALLVPRDDPQAMADAAIRVWEDGALRERLVSNGRDRVRQRFGPDQALAVWERTVDAVLRP